ncbi:MAG: hypothetical protein H5T84_03100, partial [Thermoleophilia bacterium]|nr:hypothetical protein [Thermoleophilia bacterium]
MSRSSRRDGDRRENGRRQDESQERQPAAETPERQHAGESGGAEGDSLTALKAILGKVAALLKPLQLTPDESIQLVEQLYG